MPEAADATTFSEYLSNKLGKPHCEAKLPICGTDPEADLIDRGCEPRRGIRCELDLATVPRMPLN